MIEYTFDLQDVEAGVLQSSACKGITDGSLLCGVESSSSELPPKDSGLIPLEFLVFADLCC